MPALVGEFEIINANGFHARPASAFVHLANQFDCDVRIENEGRKVSGKSILGLLTIEAYRGCVVKIHADGADAEDALNQLGKLIESGFGEG